MGKKNENSRKLELYTIFLNTFYKDFLKYGINNKRAWQSLIRGLQFVVNSRYDFDRRAFMRAVGGSAALADKLLTFLAAEDVIQVSREVGRAVMYERNPSYNKIRVAALANAARVKILEKTNGRETEHTKLALQLYEKAGIPKPDSRRYSAAKKISAE